MANGSGKHRASNVHNKSDTGFDFWSKPVFLFTMLFFWTAILVIFRSYPQMDIAVAQFFYRQVECSDATVTDTCLGFPVAGYTVTYWIREILHKAPLFIGAAMAANLIYQYSRGKRWHDSSFRNQTLVLANLIFGAFLLVNKGLKETFGRARPRELIEFGGQNDFTLAGDLIGQCMSNCSFPSGEAAAGGWFLCCGLLFAPRWRKQAYICLFILGVFTALLRVAFGAHFISDVLLGYLTTLITASILAIAFERAQKWRASF